MTPSSSQRRESALEGIAELHHIFSLLRLSFAPRCGRGAQLPSGAVTAQRRTHEGWRCHFRKTKITSPSRPRGGLGPRTCGSDRIGWGVRESGTVRAGTVRVCEIPRIEQRGQADHQVNPGGTGGKWLEGGEAKASRALGVEKPAAEEPSEQGG